VPKYLKFRLVWKAFMYETKSISGVQCVYLSTEKSNFESIYVGRPRSILLEIRVTIDCVILIQ